MSNTFLSLMFGITDVPDSQNTCPVLDLSGQNLVISGRYMLVGKEVEITSIMYGGHVFDSFYHVGYTVISTGQSRFECVEGKFQNSILNTPVYQSPFQPLSQSTDIVQS